MYLCIDRKLPTHGSTLSFHFLRPLHTTFAPNHPDQTSANNSNLRTNYINGQVSSYLSLSRAPISPLHHPSIHLMSPIHSHV